MRTQTGAETVSPDPTKDQPPASPGNDGAICRGLSKLKKIIQNKKLVAVDAVDRKPVSARISSYQGKYREKPMKSTPPRP